MAKRTPLYAAHEQAGAVFVDFAGWDMPVRYGSIIDEHHAVRKAAGIFDISHMTIVDVLGVGAREFLRYMLANDVDRLERAGKALYTCMLNERGGVIDDLIVYLMGPDKYRLILNAATHDKDLAWLEEHAKEFSIGLQERSHVALLAIQGPQAREKVFAVLHDEYMDVATTLEPFEGVEVDDWFIARTGYTGEDGFEIVVPEEQVLEFWNALLEQGVMPCGLGARDSLRLEAGLSLYGTDMDESVTPLESNLAWTVAWEPKSRNFMGRSALELQKNNGPPLTLFGLILEEKGVLRNHQKVILEEGSTGEITSGGYAPTLGCSIAFARLPAFAEGNCFVEVRGKQLRARIVKPRFVRHGQTLI